MVASGKLRESITVQSKKKTKNSYGEEDITWIDDFECFAEIKGLRGKEYFNSMQIGSVITYKIIIRYMTLSDGTRIKPNNARIIYDNDIYNILSIININKKNKELELMVVEEL